MGLMRWYSRKRQRRRGAGVKPGYLLLIPVRDWRISQSLVAFRERYQGGDQAVPHITLYGKFRLKKGIPEGYLLKTIRTSAAGCSSLGYALDGLLPMRGRKGGVIAHRIIPSADFLSFYRELSSRLYTSTESGIWIDRMPQHRIFHISILYNLRRDRAAKAATELGIGDDSPGILPVPCSGPDGSVPFNNPFTPAFTCRDALRVAIARNGRVCGEYDIPRREWLPRAKLFRTAERQDSLRSFRIARGYELTAPAFAASPETYIISDLHFGHENIIKYCSRPFSTADEMDRVLLSNWNLTVSSRDRVLFAGDLGYGSDPSRPGSCRSQLHGTVTFIQGNHDEWLTDGIPHLEFVHRGMRFLCIHDPCQAPDGFSGWIVHGHAHNNDTREYPFISYDKKRVNVSAELVGYRPLGLAELMGYLTAGSSGRLRIRPAPPKETRLNTDS